jgi:hypothetical protein
MKLSPEQRSEVPWRVSEAAVQVAELGHDGTIPNHRHLPRPGRRQGQQSANYARDALPILWCGIFARKPCIQGCRLSQLPLISPPDNTH